VRRGLTPNPDMMCNKLIKFGAFEKNGDMRSQNRYRPLCHYDGD
jgi:tRNA methyl transferase.